MSNYDARPYCKAIFALALREQNFTLWQETLDELTIITCLTPSSRNAVCEEPKNLDIITVLSKENQVTHLSSCITSRQTLIDAIITKLPMVINLLNLLLQNNQLNLLPDIAINFKNLVLEYQNTTEAKVVTTIELSDSQKQQLKQALEERYKAKILLKYEINSALIGGVVIYIRDQVIDGSIKTALHCLKQSLE